MKAMLVNSTVRVSGVHGYPNDWQGWGLIRLDDVMFFAGEKRRVQVWDVRNANGLDTGDTRDHVVTVIDTAQPLKVALVWNDPPPTAGVANPVVNNLDLTIISPDGARAYLGNVFGKDGVSVTGGAPDTINNVEVALIDNPAPGPWTLKVKGTIIARGDPGQGYALVASGGIERPQAAQAAATRAPTPKWPTVWKSPWNESAPVAPARMKPWWSWSTSLQLAAYVPFTVWRSGLRQNGWIEGKNLLVDYRHYEGHMNACQLWSQSWLL
jgi:hypothetical protein